MATAPQVSPNEDPQSVQPASGEVDNSQAVAETSAPEDAKRPSPKKWLLLLLVILIAAAGGYYYYQQYLKPKPKAVAVKKDIPLIRFATGDGPVNVFYPSKDTITASGQQLVNVQIFEGLVGWQNGTKLVPLLATSWTNPDDTSWVFNLRQGVKFHTNRVMTAEDVKYSLDKFKDVAFGGNFGDTIKSVTVVSPTQVKITTDGPDPLLLNRLANLFIVDSKGTKPDDPVNGSGPYVLKPGKDPVKDNLTKLVAFDSYWGGHVYTRELQFSQIVEESELVTALKENKIDIYDTILSQSVIKDLKTANIPVVTQQGLSVASIYFNTLRKGSALGNLKFRQALSLGIDRQAIIKAAGVDGSPVGQYMVSVVPGYVPKLTAPTQNVTQAKALIVESGVKSPSLTVSYGTSNSNLALLTEFQKQAAALGVTIKLDPIEDLDALIGKFLDGETDMFFASNSSTLFDGSDILSAFQAPGVYENPKLDDLLTKAGQTLSGSKRLDYLQQAAQELNSDVAGIPLYSRSAYYAQTNKAYTLSVDIPGVNGGGYFWKVYQ